MKVQVLFNLLRVTEILCNFRTCHFSLVVKKWAYGAYEWSDGEDHVFDPIHANNCKIIVSLRAWY